MIKIIEEKVIDGVVLGLDTEDNVCIVIEHNICSIIEGNLWKTNINKEEFHSINNKKSTFSEIKYNEKDCYIGSVENYQEFISDYEVKDISIVSERIGFEDMYGCNILVIWWKEDEDTVINTKRIDSWDYKRETVLRRDKNGSGKTYKTELEHFPSKTLTSKEKNIYEDTEIGCYYKDENGLVITPDVADYSLTFIKEQYKKFDFRKWDKNLNIIN